jgi:hypothetical protein
MEKTRGFLNVVENQPEWGKREKNEGSPILEVFYIVLQYGAGRQGAPCRTVACWPVGQLVSGLSSLPSLSSQGLQEMSVLEMARKAYERLKAQRNGHAPFASDSQQAREESEGSEESQPGGSAADSQPECEESEESEESPAPDDVASPGVSIQPCEKSEISEKSPGADEAAKLIASCCPAWDNPARDPRLSPLADAIDQAFLDHDLTKLRQAVAAFQAAAARSCSPATRARTPLSSPATSAVPRGPPSTPCATSTLAASLA